ncbi:MULTISPECIES: MCE family protein [Nocardioides]|uniref:Phospholipid/cholesterol/gamma-HCH transport system substrate-binding protein n=1 Tax=Nocardioides lianchengensis TaxID=1045774 RepID=A0A1G6TWR3_9ACTN|nr:MlaD family protein [Nocardioides lianchengensis]NYG11611.1 phospholipid/cholesterol/gamma-HCH transport system substrate-binding protein [Nocardioides lianchengensis]SDD33550.1 phospholipid/cholesterol/gamma-HCH transport system substrate-binding protein [Nocardioides lianchengensis]
MITRRTKVQLLIFVVITLVGVSFVGARYARLDRIFVDDSYTVVAHFADSGGIFAGGEVSYRGVKIGEVSELELTEDGVDVHLSIDKDQDEIPAKTLAVVGNRSAVGEQYVELQPQVDDGPYLAESSEIAQDDTRIPIATDKFLTDLSTTVGSVDQEALRTTVAELGDAFEGTGPDLQRIIDTGNSFIETANDNFDVTRALIRDSNTVLQGQVDSASSLRTFASQLKLFSGTLAASDPDLRRLIDTGSLAATELRTFLEQNGVELGDLINNLVTTGEVTVKNLPGIEQLLVIYPYIVEGGFTVVSKSSDGNYDAHFGLVLTTQAACTGGYESTDKRIPQDGSNRPMNTKAGCTEPASKSNARGPQNLAPRAPADYDAPVVASYDEDSGEVTWLPGSGADLGGTGSVAPPSLGEESWKWLYLQPLQRQE